MTIYFMGGEMPSFVPSDGTGTEVTTATSFDSGFSRCSVRPGSTTNIYTSTPALALPDEFYMHLYLGRDSTGGSTSPAFSYFASGVEVFRLLRNSATGVSTTATYQMQARIAGVMTNVGSAVTVNNLSSHHFDVYIDGNTASGTATLYVAGTEQESAAADLSSVTGIDEVRYYFGGYVSQVVIADEPTIGWRLLTRYPNGAGAATAWTGAYTDVDEIVYDDADFCNSSTNGQIEQFTQTGPAITGYSVRAVGVYARAKCGASGPVNLQIGLRVSSTDYFSSSKALSVGYSAYGEIWETNPATAAAWLSTGIDAIQPSIKAVT